MRSFEPFSDCHVFLAFWFRITTKCLIFDSAFQEQLKIIIEYYGGKYNDDLYDTTTHLLAVKYGSKKCLVATEININIVHPLWILNSIDYRKVYFLF